MLGWEPLAGELKALSQEDPASPKAGPLAIW